jgi:hypothetical protein
MRSKVKHRNICMFARHFLVQSSSEMKVHPQNYTNLLKFNHRNLQLPRTLLIPISFASATKSTGKWTKAMLQGTITKVAPQSGLSLHLASFCSLNEVEACFNSVSPCFGGAIKHIVLLLTYLFQS